MIDRGQTGFLIPPDDVEAMAVQLRTLLADEPLRLAIGARARADVFARFRAEPMVDRYEALYQRLRSQR